MKFVCFWPFCIFTALKFHDLLSHVHVVHSDDPQFSVICGIDGCTANYNKYNSLHRHISRVHRSWLERDKPEMINSEGPEENETEPLQLLLPGNQYSEPIPLDNNNNNEDSLNDNQDDVSDIPLTSVTLQPVNLHTNHMPANPDDFRKRSAAVCCLRLKEKNRLSQRAVDNIVAGTSNLFHETMWELKDRISKRLREAGTGSDICDEIEDMCDEMSNPFDGLETEWLQDAYIKEHFGFVEPVSKELGKKMVYRGTGSKRQLVEVTKMFYYVPFLETLQKQLSKSNILQIMLSNNGYSKDNKLRSFSDGLLSKSHPVFSMNTQALQIILYHDEIQLCNAVGNRIRTHKLYMFYFILLNLPLKYRTKLEDINLVAIARSVDVKEYGFDAILQPLLVEIQQLASPDGFRFILDDGRCVHLQGALAAYIADTPASHEAAGFKEGVGLAFKKCRHCHATYETMQSNFLEENFDLRNLQEHLNHLDTMADSERNLVQHFSMIYGINRPSILLQFPHFDICQQMPEDVMHVLFEGVIPYTVKLVLHYFIKTKKCFSLKQINGRLSGFNYAYFNKKYQPNPLSQNDLNISDNKFSQDADQMWMLFTILPFLVDDFVDLEDEHWLVYLMLMEITRISLSPVLSLETISRLKQLINDFLTLFKSLFVQQNITPKMHYLVHFPRILVLLGPLVNFWCMRMESKHSYFKSLRGVVGYKNVPFSLAKRHQKLACFNGLDSFEQSSNNVGKSKRLTEEEQIRAIDRLQRYFSIDTQQITSIYSCSWADIDNIKYVPKECVLLTGSDDNENPVFCKLESIIFVNDPDHIFFQCQSLDTVCFNDKLCAYQIEKPNMASGLILCTKDQLKIHQPLQLIYHNENTYVCCRYNLEDIIDDD